MNNQGNRDLKAVAEFAVQPKMLAVSKLETGNVIQRRNGSWQRNLLLKAENLQRWGFIAIEPSAYYQPDYAGIISQIKHCGRKMGMALAEPSVALFNESMQNVKHTLNKCMGKGIHFIIIILPTSGRDYYKKVKDLEREFGVLTQCVKEGTALRRMHLPVVKNVLLKVNSRLNSA